MSASPVVSVITPVYNGEQYLAECIESVFRQTFDDWEYVIVDNASTDGTAAIADRYAALDPRVRVVHASELVDIYANHNRSLRLIDSGSRYCKFVHADDWLYPQCLEQMVTLAEKHPSVGVVSSFYLEDRHVGYDSPVPYSQAVLTGTEAIRQEMLGLAYPTGSPTTTLLRADLVRDHPSFYDRTFWHADTEAAFRLLLQCDMGFIQQVLTFTRLHPQALTQFSHRVNSYITKDGRLLLRYGPTVFGGAEYRTRMRMWLRRYGCWLAKQLVKPWRRRQREFHDFHKREIAHMLAEAGTDRTIRVTLSLYCRLLHTPST